MEKMAKVSVLGAGSWGTALSLLLCKNGHEVTLWSALEDEVRMLCEKREHESKLPGSAPSGGYEDHCRPGRQSAGSGRSGAGRCRLLLPEAQLTEWRLL